MGTTCGVSIRSIAKCEDNMETVTIEERTNKPGGLSVTVHGEVFLLESPGQSLEILTRDGQHWFLSQTDGQSFTRVNYKSLKIRLVKAWSILRGKGWWEHFDIVKIDSSGSGKG